MITSLVFNERLIRTGHLLIAMRGHRELSRCLLDISGEFTKINAELLQDNFQKMTEDSSETASPVPEGENAATGQAGAMLAPPSMGKGEALRLYTVDMT